MTQRMWVVVPALLIVSVLPAAPGGATFGGVNGKIVYRGVGTDFCPDIYTTNPDGTSITKLTACPQIAKDPAFSPDASKIAFVGAASTGVSSTDLYTMNAGGGVPTSVTSDSNDDDDPAWSPDGSTLVFGRDMVGPDSGNIVKVASSGGVPGGTLTNNGGANDYPDWSPDGGKIAWSAKIGGVSFDIWTMNPDGQSPVNLTPNTSSNELYASWSPDGRKIAFATNRDGNYEIYSMNSDGTFPTRLTNNPAPDIQPSFSPDGTQIAFTRGCQDDDCQGQPGDIYRMNADGTGPTAVVATPAAESDPDWGVGFACPTCATPTPTPQPSPSPTPPPTNHPRSVSLNLSGHLKASGVVRVSDGFGACSGNVSVRIQKRRSGTFKTIKTVTTGAPQTGGTPYRASIPDRTGKYRVKLPSSIGGPTDVCEAAVSPTRTHRH